MNTDHHFYIGKTHKICEDYAASGISNGIGYAIVSDGCSSSVNTDIGSRLLTLAAIQSIHLVDSPDQFRNNVIFTARANANMMGVNVRCLEATLLVAAITDNHAHIHMIGDGVCVIKYNNKKPTIIHGAYPQNTPYYLNYIGETHLENSLNKLYKDDNGDVFCEHNLEVSDIISSDCYPWYYNKLSTDGISTISVITDGVESFQMRETSDVDIKFSSLDFKDVALSVTDFKNCNGEFVKRTLHAAMNNFTKKSVHHNDDFSMASIKL